MRLTGIRFSASRDRPEEVATSPGLIQEILTEEWRPVYCRGDINIEKATSLLGAYVRKQGHLVDFANLALPIVEDFEVYIAINRESDGQPGKDGTSYCAYRIVSEISARVLHSTFVDLS